MGIYLRRPLRIAHCARATEGCGSNTTGKSEYSIRIGGRIGGRHPAHHDRLAAARRPPPLGSADYRVNHVETHVRTPLPGVRVWWPYSSQISQPSDTDRQEPGHTDKQRNADTSTPSKQRDRHGVTHHSPPRIPTLKQRLNRPPSMLGTAPVVHDTKSPGLLQSPQRARRRGAKE